MRCGDIWREPLAIGVRHYENIAEIIPFACEEALSGSDCRIANAFKDLKDLAVAVDMPFCDLPVVNAGIARLARVADGDAAFERVVIESRPSRFMPSTPKWIAATPPNWPDNNPDNRPARE